MQRFGQKPKKIIIIWYKVIQTRRTINIIYNLEENLTLPSQIKLSYKTQHTENALQIYQMYHR